MAFNTSDSEVLFEHPLVALYLSHFDQAPEYAVYRHYVDVLEDLIAEYEGDPAWIANVSKALSTVMYYDSGADPNITNEAYVTLLYQRMLGREPDPEGLAYWVNELANGASTRGELALVMAVAAAYDERDGDYLKNRADVGVAFAHYNNSNASMLPWQDYDATSILDGVNENPDTVIAALDRLPATAPRTGGVYDLTPAADTIQGTGGDDLINAFWVTRTGEAASTLTAGDFIDGGGGHDVFNIYINVGNHYNTVMPADVVIRNIHVVNLYNDGADISTLTDVSRYEGIHELWQIGHASKVTSLTSDVMAGFRDIGMDELLEVAVDESADSATIRFENVSDSIQELMVYADDSEFDTFTLNLSGWLYGECGCGTPYALVTQILNESVQTLVVNTEFDIDLWVGQGPRGEQGEAVTGNLSTLDASGSSGAVTVYVNGHGLSRILTGDGDDLIIFEPYRRITLDDEIDGGGGINAVGFAQESFSSEEYEAMRNMRNIDRVAFSHPFAVVEASELSPYKQIAVSSGAIPLDDSPNPEVMLSEVLVYDLAADQMLHILAMDEHEEHAGYVILVDAAADVHVNMVNWYLAPDAGSYLVVTPPGDAQPRGTLTVSGDAWLTYDNRDGLFSVIDARDLVAGGLDLSFWETPDAEVPQTGMSNLVAEAVLLGDAEDWITLQVSFDPEVISSSTVGLMDIIHFFNSGNGSGDVDVIFGIDRYELLELSDQVTTLDEAFAEAAARYERDPDGAVNVLFFHFEDNTYLYADTWADAGSGTVDANDFAIAFVGIHNFSDDIL